MKRHLLISLLCILLLPCRSTASDNREQEIHTLTTIVDDNPLQLPVMRMGSGSHVVIGFDCMTHEYHRYIYKVVLCNADWTVNEELFESDYIEGYAERPIDDYEKSFNTVQNYTHYSVTLPNPDTGLKMCGNYKVLIIGDESDDDDEPLAEARFMVIQPKVGISGQVRTATDIDLNQRHQQLEMGIQYGTLKVIDPQRELTCVVMQNRRTDNMVFRPQPNIQHAAGVEFSHRRELIFPASAEYHKFELLDINTPGMGIDETEWIDPYHHATLTACRTGRNYDYTEDHNGAYVVRNTDNEDNDTQSDYFVVHFTLQSLPLLGGKVVVAGDWCPEGQAMEYDPENGCYETGVLLKSGYYEFQYRFIPDGQTRGSTAQTDGDFHETENEYNILVYHRPPGGRNDNLVGYQVIRYSAVGR